MTMTSSTSTDPRAAYLSATVQTASPQQLLLLLLDRLVLDVRRGLAAQESGDRQASHRHLLHAQDIVAELRVTLDVDAWEGAPQLARLYDFLLAELIRANTSGAPATTAGCLELCIALADTWRAAGQAASS